jgi:hypothetical protein
LDKSRSEVSPARLRYELPKLGIAGSNPALRTFFLLILLGLLTKLLTMGIFKQGSVNYGNFLLTTAARAAIVIIIIIEVVALS